MTTFYFYCHICKTKGKIMDRREADTYLSGKISQHKWLHCCGEYMGLRSDNILIRTFPKSK